MDWTIIGVKFIVSTVQATQRGTQQMTQSEKIADAEMRGSHWLAEGNAASERGNKAKAEKCYSKSQFWLDRANKLRGWN